jgi:hypothetical protein
VVSLTLRSDTVIGDAQVTLDSCVLLLENVILVGYVGAAFLDCCEDSVLRGCCDGSPFSLKLALELSTLGLEVAVLGWK